MTLWVAGALSVGFFLIEALLDLELQESGEGILAFEVAGTSERAREIVEGWATDQSLAELQLWLDYPFLAAVAVFVATVVLAVGDRLPAGSRLRAAAPAAAWLPIAAGVADIIENSALLVILGGEVDQPLPAIAFAGAILKYACGAAALIFVGAGLWLSRRVEANDSW